VEPKFGGRLGEQQGGEKGKPIGGRHNRGERGAGRVAIRDRILGGGRVGD
jgi:hypothetical protein